MFHSLLAKLRLASTLLREGLANKYYLFYAPKTLQDTMAKPAFGHAFQLELPDAPQLEIIHTRQLEQDWVLEAQPFGKPRPKNSNGNGTGNANAVVRAEDELDVGVVGQAELEVERQQPQLLGAPPAEPQVPRRLQAGASLAVLGYAHTKRGEPGPTGSTRTTATFAAPANLSLRNLALYDRLP